MSTAATLRVRIESALANRIPSALSPGQPTVRPVASTGIPELDTLVRGGLPQRGITELVGAECSGRTAVALSFAARMTQEAKVCAWLDVSNALSPESAAASGIDLKRLLWVRCGIQPPAIDSPSRNSFALPKKYFVPTVAQKGLHGGGFGPHPRTEARGMPEGISGLLREPAIARARQRTVRPVQNTQGPLSPPTFKSTRLHDRITQPWGRIEQGLRATDLLLQTGGFSAIVLDLGSIAPEHVSRIPLATWFRYRAAAERNSTSVLLLTQHACSKSSAELVLRLQAVSPLSAGGTVLAGVERRIEVTRQRYTESRANVVELRKPPQRVSSAEWRSKTGWAGLP